MRVKRTKRRRGIGFVPPEFDDLEGFEHHCIEECRKGHILESYETDNGEIDRKGPEQDSDL